LPSIHTVYNKVKQTGLTVLLIDIKESRSTVQAAVKERGYTLPILLDSDGAVTQAYGVIATPTIYLLDSDHFAKARAMGPHDWDSPLGLKILKSLNKK
jgi:peroxiredoxin